MIVKNMDYLEQVKHINRLILDQLVLYQIIKLNQYHQDLLMDVELLKKDSYLLGEQEKEGNQD